MLRWLQASLRKRADLQENRLIAVPIETTLLAAGKIAPILRKLADLAHRQESQRLQALVKSRVKTSQAALCGHYSLLLSVSVAAAC